jgi:hypothetical protein
MLLEKQEIEIQLKFYALFFITFAVFHCGYDIGILPTIFGRKIKKLCEFLLVFHHKIDPDYDHTIIFANVHKYLVRVIIEILRMYSILYSH